MIQRVNPGELHIWWANLRDFDADLPAFQAILSPLERTRAEEFHFRRNRNNHIISRGILRSLLGSYVAQSPCDLRFAIGENGNLVLQTDSSGTSIYFNLSHSGDVALYGFTRECPVGVDVEYIRPIPHYERISLEYLSRSETEDLIVLPKERQSRYFFSLWTRKEALLKAMGVHRGNGREMRDAFDSEARREISNRKQSPLQISSDWAIHSFSPTLGYIAAVAFRQPDLDLSYRSVSSLFSSALPGSGTSIPQNSEWV